MSENRKITIPKTAMDLQKMKLEKLMMNPDKPVIIPERPKEKKNHSVPEFVRNVMGSSAGAGSGEFHVYRHLRRKEYSRQKMIEEMAQKEEQDRIFAQKLEENKRKLEEKTARKRAKRLKRKERLKQKRNLKKVKKEEEDTNVKSKPTESGSNESCSDSDEGSSDSKSRDSEASDSECRPES